MVEHNDEEKSYVELDASGQEKLKLDVFFKTIMQRCMGKCLDFGRISGMSDRSFEQFKKSIKDEFYKIIDNGNKILEEHGHVAKKSEPKK